MLAQLVKSISDLTDTHSGFLPSKAPLVNLPAPFERISKACSEFSRHYHGENLDVRPWLDQEFSEPDPTWREAVEKADQYLLENLMTKVSLLCHAYRWQRMPTPPENYSLKKIDLPKGLEPIWDQLSSRLQIPRVGIFYTMVCNNWKLKGVEPGQSYNVDEIEDANIELIHSWLNSPVAEELRTFVSTALCMESKGAKILKRIQKIYRCIDLENSQEATYHMMVLEATLTSVYSIFNRGIKKQRIVPTNFLKFVQPTMIWLLDHGEGPLEGASGPQACTIQMVDCFLGVPRNSALGEVILKSRKYMLPKHKKLLENMDGASSQLRDFVLKANDHRLLEAYNRCLKLMTSWRVSHQKRAAMYIKGDEGEKVGNYVSTGLVVNNEEKRGDYFEKTMQGHIDQTKTQSVENRWQGLEKSFDYLFRFLSEEQKALFFSQAKRQRLKKGEAIINEGDFFPGLYSLVNGTASVYKKNQVVATIQSNEVIGEMSLIENLPASAAVRANEDLDLIHISLESVYELISSQPGIEAGFYLAIAGILSQRLRGLEPAQINS